MVVFKVIISILLLIGILAPRVTWQISEGWKYKDAEPHTFYLVMTRVVSALTLFALWILVP